MADVTDSGASVSDRYMFTDCYVMEYVEGVARKLGEFPAECRPDHVEKALQAFHEACIHYLIDASVFFPRDPDNFKFIDFGVEQYPAIW